MLVIATGRDMLGEGWLEVRDARGTVAVCHKIVNRYRHRHRIDPGERFYVVLPAWTWRVPGHLGVGVRRTVRAGYQLIAFHAAGAPVISHSPATDEDLRVVFGWDPKRLSGDELAQRRKRSRG